MALSSYLPSSFSFCGSTVSTVLNGTMCWYVLLTGLFLIWLSDTSAQQSAVSCCLWQAKEHLENEVKKKNPNYNHVWGRPHFRSGYFDFWEKNFWSICYRPFIMYIFLETKKVLWDSHPNPVGSQDSHSIILGLNRNVWQLDCKEQVDSKHFNIW